MSRIRGTGQFAAVIERLLTVDERTPVPVHVPEVDRTTEGVKSISKLLRAHCRYYGLKIKFARTLDGRLMAVRTNGD